MLPEHPIGIRRLLPQVPGWRILRSYQRSWLKQDLLAGTTVTAYLVPQVMAYATIAGVPPVVGLWTMLPSLLAYFLLGTSRRMSVGPESTTALMSAVAVAPLAGGDANRYIALTAALAVMVGLMGVLAWALRLGFIADLLSKPVLIGYMAGIALLMVVSQLEKLTGVSVDSESVLAQILEFSSSIGSLELATTLLGCLALIFLFVVSWRKPNWPVPLLTVLLGTIAVIVLNLERFNIQVVGTFERSLPQLTWPSWSDLALLVVPAIGVLIVSYTDFALTARAFSTNHDPRIDNNQELFALGTANMASGIIGGFAISSSGSRTALAIAAHAKTQVYSVVVCIWVFAVIMVLGPLLARFPTAVLGAIVIYAASKLVDLAGFKQLWHFRQTEFWLAIITFVSVLWLGILYGVAIAVALSVIEMLRRVARPHDAVIGFVPGLAGMHDVDDYPTAHTIPGLVVYRYDSPLFFANAEDFRSKALAAVEEYQEDETVYWLLLNMEANVEVDSTGLTALKLLSDKLTERNVVLALCRVKTELYEPLESFGLVDQIGANRIYPTLPVAVAAYKAWRADQQLHPQADDAGGDLTAASD